MKKILFTVVFSLFTIVLLGQNKFKIGVNSGLTFSNFRGNDTPVTEQKYGFDFMAGLSLEYSLSEKLSLKTNLTYDRKTGIVKSNYNYRPSFDEPSVFVIQKVRSNYNYLTMPVFIKYNFGKYNSYFINGGPFVGFLLSSKFVDKSKQTPSSLDFNEDTSDLNKKTDFGFSYGVGKLIPLDEKNDLVIELRQNLGLVNTSDVPVYNNGEIKTNSFNLIVGWSFGI